MAKTLELLEPNVVELCRVRKITRAELARLIGMKPQQMSRQLKGKTDFQVSFLDRLAQGLGVEPGVLLKDKVDVAGLSEPRDEVAELKARVERLERKDTVPSKIPSDLLDAISENANNTMLLDMLRAVISVHTRPPPAKKVSGA